MLASAAPGDSLGPPLAAWLCIIWLLLSTDVASQEVPPADVSTYPWSAIGKLNNSVGGSCTGVVIDRARVLTAAHCIFNRRTDRFLPPSSLHLLLGYQRGSYSVHARVADYTVGRGYDPKDEEGSLASDWSVLRLAEPLPETVRPLQVADYSPQSGIHLSMGSYAGRRVHVMNKDVSCRVLGAEDRAGLFAHDCGGGFGSSGAPLFVIDREGVATVVGVQVAIARRDTMKVMLAIPAARIRAQISE